MWLRQLPMPICPDIEQAILPSRLKFCPDREQASVRIIRGPNTTRQPKKPAMWKHAERGCEEMEKGTTVRE